jgi:hypothetical protein
LRGRSNMGTVLQGIGGGMFENFKFHSLLSTPSFPRRRESSFQQVHCG